MDSEHRHELKENDLAVAMATAKDWWGKHQMKVLSGAVLLAAIILGVRWMSASASASRDDEQYKLSASLTPDAFRALAQATGNDSIEVQANLRGADAILPLVRKPVGTGPEQITPENRKQYLDNAEAMYKAVLSDAKHPLPKIKAHMGLASIAETRGEWAKAKEHYQAAQKVGTAGFEFLNKRAAAFEAALPRIQVEPVYARAEAPKEKELDPLKLPFLTPEQPKNEKDGKSDDTPSLPLFPLTPEKDAKAPAPAPVPAPAPAPVPAPAPAPEKDAKTEPAKDAK